MKRFTRAFVPWIATAGLWSGGASAVEFVDFSNTGNLTLSGSAAVVSSGDGRVLRVTPATGSQSGSAFSTQTVSADFFSTAFKFRITDPGGPVFDCNTKAGADGLVFVIQPVSSSIGGSGQGIGYEGIRPSVAVEFDTWCNAGNNDPSSNHVAININGSVVHDGTSSVADYPAADFDNGNIWYAWVDYDGTTLEVRVSPTNLRPDTALLRRAIDIPATLGGVRKAYVGFTSGTGLDWGNHDVLSWRYDETFNPTGSKSVLSGTVNRLQTYNVVCQNFTGKRKKRRVLRNVNASSWDCEAAGLAVEPGDRVTVTISGRAPR